MQPVAVIISYRDWQRIESILQNYSQEQDVVHSTNLATVLAACAGSIRLTIDPLQYQQQERSPWL